MQNPGKDINHVVHALTTATSPDIQKAVVQRYFTQDAGLRHPLVYVAPGPNSRESILGIYQWYRTIYPHVDTSVQQVSYDAEKNVLVLDIATTIHMPFASTAPVPLITRLHLRQDGELHYMALQETTWTCVRVHTRGAVDDVSDLRLDGAPAPAPCNATADRATSERRCGEPHGAYDAGCATALGRLVGQRDGILGILFDDVHWLLGATFWCRCEWGGCDGARAVAAIRDNGTLRSVYSRTRFRYHK